MKYAQLHRQFRQANENEIYNLTGCLSKCDRFKYRAEPVDGITSMTTEDARLNNTIRLMLYYPSGEYVSMEQVNAYVVCMCLMIWLNATSSFLSSSPVHNLRLEILHRGRWWLPWITSRPKYLWLLWYDYGSTEDQKSIMPMPVYKLEFEDKKK